MGICVNCRCDPCRCSIDPVNHPSHYTEGGIETIDILKAKLSGDAFQGFCLGNAIKYLTRARHKNSYTEDLQKARWYIDKAIKEFDPYK